MNAFLLDLALLDISRIQVLDFVKHVMQDVKYAMDHRTIVQHVNQDTLDSIWELVVCKIVLLECTVILAPRLVSTSQQSRYYHLQMSHYSSMVL